MFVRSGTTWSQQTKLEAREEPPDDFFGTSVAVSSETAVAGAPGTTRTRRRRRLGLRVRRAVGWAGVKQALLTRQEAAGDNLRRSRGPLGRHRRGRSCRCRQGGCGGRGGGLRLPALPAAGDLLHGWHVGQRLPGAALCQRNASATAPCGFTLSATAVEGQKDGLFFFGTNGQQANPWGNGTSYQCVVPPVVRAGTLAGSGRSACATARSRRT